MSDFEEKCTPSVPDKPFVFDQGPAFANEVEKITNGISNHASGSIHTRDEYKASVYEKGEEETTLITSGYKKQDLLKSISDKDKDEVLESLSFAKNIKVLLVPSPDSRLLCYFLGTDSVYDIKSASQGWVPLIGFLVLESVMEFMQKNDYVFSGEIDFDSHGNAIPVSKHVWSIKNKELSFTKRGLMFFEHKSGDKDKNVAFYVFANMNEQICGITCQTKSIEFSKTILRELEDYTKANNCLRGTKLREVNVLRAEFTEVKNLENYTWENYYYEDSVQNIFNLEVFGFLNNIERCNNRGVYKRGVMFYGQPGTGKTTLAKIICNYSQENTVIWITPELIAENNSYTSSIKLLYLLADFVSPSIIFLEDIDLFAEDRDERQSDSLRVGGLMNILDGVNSIKNAITIASTNRIELIENALKNRPGRFDRLIEIESLNKDLRKKMLKDRLSDCTLESESVMTLLVKESDNWTGAQIQDLIDSINMRFVGENIDKDGDRLLTKKIAAEVLETIQSYTYVKKSKRKGIGFNDSD